MNEVTVIIPNYNGKHFLKRCLNSIYEGDLVPDVILVDNGSNDGSVQMALAAFPHIQLLPFKENQGFCKAVNAGINKAETEYVILLNNDTVVSRSFVSELLSAIKQDRRIFSASAKLLSMSDPSQIDDAGDFYCVLGWAFARGKHRPSSRYNQTSRIFAACAGAAIYRKALIEELNYFDEAHFAYLEDIDIGYRAQIFGCYNLFVPSAEVLHAGSAASGSRYNHFKTDLTSRNSIYLIYKNMPLLQIVINLPFLLIGFMIKFLFFTAKGMGFRYLGGLMRGFALSGSQHGKNKKVRFKWRNFGHYVDIQIQLYLNLFRRINFFG